MHNLFRHVILYVCGLFKVHHCHLVFYLFKAWAFPYINSCSRLALLQLSLYYVVKKIEPHFLKLVACGTLLLNANRMT